MCECVYESKYQTNSNALEIYIYVITAGISDGSSTQHKGPRGHIQCILVQLLSTKNITNCSLL